MEVNGKFCGYLCVKEDSEALILNELEIHPKEQGRGLGTEVLKELISESQKRGAPIRLQVLNENRAKSLYERFGFKTCGRTDTHTQMIRESTT